MKCKGIILFVLWALEEADCALNVRKYVDHKDMSEYCKRRVIPSMFLGKHVKDGNLNLIYFSKLELPYSCMLTVRTESGNNIILVIQLVTEHDLKDACSRNENQLIVYELGETFGGYWGPLSDEVVNPTTSNITKYYTLKTAPPFTTSSTISSEEEEIEEITDKVPLTGTIVTDTMERDKYITMDVPLVNISGNLQLAGRPYQLVDEMFDAVYDVTPKKNVEYSTTLMPLVKFSIHEPVQGRSGVNMSNEAPLYDLDYDVEDEGFTLDPRTAHKRILTKKSKWSENRRLHFNDKNVKKITKSTRLKFNRLFTKQKVSKNKFSHAKHYVEEPRVYNGRNSVSTASWYFLDDIIKSYNLTSSTMWENTTAAMLLENLENIKNPNISAYLFSNLSLYNGLVMDDETQTKNKEHMELFTTRFKELSSLEKNDFSNLTLTVVENTTNTISIDHKSSTQTYNTATKIQNEKPNSNNVDVFNEVQENLKNVNVTNAQENVNDSFLTTSIDVTKERHVWTITTNKAPPTGSLVDHESWENIVRVAPVLATVLNKTDTLGNKSDNVTTNTDDERRNISKRHVKALDFGSFDPKTYSRSTPHAPVVTDSGYMFSDMQDLANLIEIQDDEIQGRIALRYLRNYIGPVLYNICDFEHGRGARHVHLLNSSRIVISINNFTLNRLMLVVTPALALLNTKAQCPPSHIECQILGTRVCVDSINSCDGVPNCGSNDIYDEDRIMCGFSASAQYVIFAAFAFLVVVLTMMYITHYWLMRCVPRVSEAFFIYADDSENTLRLRTSMRAPMDDDDSLQTFYLPGTFSDADLVCQDIMVKKNENLCMQWLRRFFYCNLCKKQNAKYIEKLKEEQQELESIASNIEQNKAEPQKITLKKDKTTQTRKSLEDNIFSNNDGIEGKSLDIISEDQFNELSLIKLINERRSTLQRYSHIEYEGIKENDKEEFKFPVEETELQSTLYERMEPVERTETFQKMLLKSYDEESVEKHLRFIEEPTFIPELTDEDELQQSHSNIYNQPSFSGMNFVKTTTHNQQGTKEENKDHKKFWPSPKGKKSKKFK